MSTIAAPECGVTIRDATTADNGALIALSAACPMEGDIALCVNRFPDFFALSRVEGDCWRVGVAESSNGAIVGCVALAKRTVYLQGRPQETIYLSDLKVHPAYRGLGVADSLSRYVRDASEAIGGPDIPALLTVLAGNRPMERRAAGPRGLARLTRFTTIRSYAVSLLWRRRIPASDLRVCRARLENVEEMAALWRRVAPSRQFAPVYDAASLARWIRNAPALDISSYWIARDRNGRLVGFLGLWDQHSFKQLRVVGYSRRLAIVRAAFNGLLPMFGGTRLPPPGGPLRYLSAVHVCVPANQPRVLRSLILRAYNELRGRGYSFFTIGLDTRDPLASALRGLLAQPTDVHAYVSVPAGEYTGPALDDRPLHFEIALV